MRHRSSEQLTLLGRIDYQRTLSQQLPPAPHRVVYSKGGMYLAAARVDDPRVVIDHKLYWATAADSRRGALPGGRAQQRRATAADPTVAGPRRAQPPRLRQVHLPGAAPAARLFPGIVPGPAHEPHPD